MTKKIAIDFDGSKAPFLCPVTNEVLYSEENSFIGLSKASLFYYWEPEFEYASENE
jgi:hypothetical protein